MQKLNCFKAYDIRGEIGVNLDEDIAYRIGKAMAIYLSARIVIVGGDCRLSTTSLKDALIEGLRDGQCNVIDIGLCGTEEIYFATTYLEADGGVMITASHNPKNFNGMKLVREKSKPISGDTGLFEIQKLAETMIHASDNLKGTVDYLTTEMAYVEHLLSYIEPSKLTPLKFVVNAGNGVAGHIIDAIEKQFLKREIPVSFVKLNNQPDGEFPHGVPNPLLVENRSHTRDAVLFHQADMGIAWDGDFDRCFFFDEKGNFIEGYYIVGLLAEMFLQRNSAEKIIHDPRLTWNTVDVTSKNGGIAIESKTGHAFIKERMRKENAVYGGEMSAHHYFRDFSYCDSGMIPWLLVMQLLCEKNLSLSSLVGGAIDKFPSSGEINRKVADPDSIIQSIKNNFSQTAKVTQNIDGLSMAFDDWRFNLRKSNTEALLRLNVETRQDPSLLKRKVASLLSIIDTNAN